MKTGGYTSRGGADGRTGEGPGTAGTLYATIGKDRGLAHGAAVHSQWDGAGGPGMAQRPLSALWPGSPRPFKYCDRCQAQFSISHALDCKKGGLVTARHNELLDGVADLAGKSFNPSHVRDDPLIYSGRAVRRTKPTPAGSTKPNPLPVRQQQRQRSRSIRATFLSGTSGNRGLTVLTTCVS